MDKEDVTINYYDREAENWASAHHGNEEESYWKEEMERFHQLLPKGRVLEIGSGAGKDASALIRMGYEYVGTDASEGLLKVAQRRNPEASFKKVSVYDLDFPARSFDGFWTAATLLHIPKKRIDEALQRIKSQIKPDGVGFITVKAGAGERPDPETGRLFSYYSQKGFKRVLERNNFEVVEESTRKGQKDWWLCYWVRN
jgi:ubiquinone/menaquinone biosynthesis C-methylase UbiE